MLSMYRKTCLFLFILIFYGCPKEDFSDNCISYSFNTNGLHFYPESDSIKVGDTLWVTYVEPLNPIPIGEKDTVDIRGIEFYNYLNFLEFPYDTVDGNFKVINKFNIITTIGKNYLNPGFSHIKYFSGISYDGSYVAKIALVPIKKGDFIIGSDIGIGNTDSIIKNGKCYKYHFITPIANDDKHINRFRAKYGDIGISDQYINNIYCFTVY